MGWLFALGLAVIVLATSSLTPPSQLQTSGTAVLQPGGTYELVAIAPVSTGATDWQSLDNQTQLRSELLARGAKSVSFVRVSQGTAITLVQKFESGGSIPLGTAIFSNAKLASVRRLG